MERVTVLHLMVLLFPLVIFFYATVKKEYNFSTLSAAIFGTVISRIIFVFSYMGVQQGFISIAQLIVATIGFVALVFFLGKKVTGETVLLLCGAVALSPYGWEMIVILGFGLVGSTYYASRKWKAAYGESINNIALEAAFDLGLLTKSKPDLTRLPEREEKESHLRVSTAPWYLYGTALTMILVSLGTII